MTESTLTRPVQSMDPWLSEFSKIERAEANAGSPSWLPAFRKAGFARFGETGMPTTSDEDWRFTPLTPITRMPFKPLLGEGSGLPEGLDLAALPLGELPGFLMVFVDGAFVRSASRLAGLPEGVIACGMKEALNKHASALEGLLGSVSKNEDNPFAALNSAFFQDGAYIHVPAQVRLQTPIRLIYFSTGPQPGAVAHYRNLVVAGVDSGLQIVEEYAAKAGHPYLTNAVTEIHAAARADLEVVKFQDESSDAGHVSMVAGRFGRESRVRIHSIALGGRLARNNIRVCLAGPGLECVLNGLYLTCGDQLADHHMVVEHAEPNCASHEYFNGILDDRSRGVFHGRILVRSAAQKTDAKQTNKNLLLSDDAVADTKPQLEIYADDVRCTHGATIGQLNDESIFYLRARGIGLKRARQMLIHAFAGEIIERIQCAPAREAIDKIVWDRLELNPHLAEGEGV